MTELKWDAPSIPFHRLLTLVRMGMDLKCFVTLPEKQRLSIVNEYFDLVLLFLALAVFFLASYKTSLLWLSSMTLCKRKRLRKGTLPDFLQDWGFLMIFYKNLIFTISQQPSKTRAITFMNSATIFSNALHLIKDLDVFLAMVKSGLLGWGELTCDFDFATLVVVFQKGLFRSMNHRHTEHFLKLLKLTGDRIPLRDHILETFPQLSPEQRDKLLRYAPEYIIECGLPLDRIGEGLGCSIQ